MRNKDESDIEDAAMRETAAGYTTPTITFRNTTTGETLEVPNTPEARALAAQQSGMNRKERRAQEAGIKRALRKGKR